jgi:hypothetical protein
MLQIPSCDFLLPSLTPTYSHSRYLLLRYHHDRNLYILLLFRLRPQLLSYASEMRNHYYRSRECDLL